MIAPLPPDRALPGLPALLDEERAIVLLSANLGTTGAVEIAGCRPRYVRYKPEASCLIQYDLSVRDASGHQTDAGAYIRVFVDDRAQRRAESGRMQRLRERYLHRHADLPCDPVAWLPDVNGVFQIFPIDYELRFLVRAMDPSSMTGELRQSNRALADVDIVGAPELVRYKPERKALLRYRLRNAPVKTMYGKLLTDDRGELLADQTQRLMAAGVPTPPVVVVSPKRKFIGHAETQGIQLASLRGEDSYAGWMEPLAESLARLRSVDLPTAPVHTLADEMSVINETALWLSRIAPHLTVRLDHLSDELTSRLGAMDERIATCHGDFYDDQALVGDAGVTIIDLDELRRGHPLLDTGNMLAHLTSGAARGDDVTDARDAFLTASLRHTPYSEADVALFEAAALLKLAPGPFRRLEADWPGGIERILRLAETQIADRHGADWSPSAKADIRGQIVISTEVEKSIDWGESDALISKRFLDGVYPEHSRGTWNDKPVVSPCSGDHLLIDPELPQLARLQDPAAMSGAFSAGFGNGQVSVAGISLVRHKPGRRAILRYEVDHGGSDLGERESFYGKSFASNRGARVYDIVTRIATAKAFGPEVALPEPIAFLPDERLLVQRSVAGEPIQPALLAGDTGLVSTVASALHRFHHSGLDLGRSHDLTKELGPLTSRAVQVCDAQPALRGLAESCLARIEDVGRADLPWRYLPIHRDFYHDQVLVHDGALAVLDLDDAAMSEPAVDVANFVAHLTLLGAQQRGDAAALAPLQHAFVRQYCRLDPDLDPDLLRFLTATTLLRLAGIHAPRENGRFVATSLLVECDRLLGTRSPLVV